MDNDTNERGKELGWITPWMIYSHLEKHYLVDLKTTPRPGGTASVRVEQEGDEIKAYIHPDEVDRMYPFSGDPISEGLIQVVLVIDLCMISPTDRRIAQRLEVIDWAGKYNKKLAGYIESLPLDG